MDNKVKVVGYSQAVKYTDGIEYRNFSDSLVGQQFTDDGGSVLFTAGNFNISTNLDSKETRQYRTRSFSDFISLDTLEKQNIERFIETNSVKLNYNFDNLSTYAYFGSLKEFVSYSIQDIINRFPASLYVDTLNQIDLSTTGNTVLNLTYNNDLTTTFEVDVQQISNPFGLNYLQSGTIVNDIKQETNISNLTDSYLNYVVELNGKEYSVLGFTGSTLYNSGTVKITIDGIMENIVDIPFHIKPNQKNINNFYKSLNGLQGRLLNRNSTPLNTFFAKYQITTDNGVLVNTYKQLTWDLLDGYNIDVTTVNFEQYIADFNEVVDFFDENNSDIIYRRLISQAITDFDTLPKDSDFDQDSGEKITSLIRVYGRSFDDIKIYIDNIPNVYSQTYNKLDNTPDSLIKTIANMLGFETPNIILNKKTEKDNLYGYIDTDYVENEIWRRLVLNSNWLFTSKGTRKVIEFIFNLLGIPSQLVNINEYVYKAKNIVDIDKLTLAINKLKEDGKDISLDEISIDLDGYPSINRDIPFQSNGGWYQETYGDNSVVDILSGNNPHIGVYDNGSSYYDQFRTLIPNFNPIKVTNTNVLNRKVNLYFNYNFGKINNSVVDGTNFDCYDCDIIEKQVEVVNQVYSDSEGFNGYLYNWYTINGGDIVGNGRVSGGIVNLTQTDWVVPSQTQLQSELLTALGGILVAGGKLKVTGTEFWDSPNTGADNSSKFNAKGSGTRGVGGVYNQLKTRLVIWSSTQSITDFCSTLYVDFDKNNVILQNNRRDLGLTIRLCRPKTISENDGDIILDAYVGNNGKVYNGVVIGNLVWINEDLQETKNNLGENIEYLDETKNDEWVASLTDKTPYYTKFYLNTTTNLVTIQENPCIKCPDGYVYNEISDLCEKEDKLSLSNQNKLPLVRNVNCVFNPSIGSPDYTNCTNTDQNILNGAVYFKHNNELVIANYAGQTLPNVFTWFFNENNIPLEVTSDFRTRKPYWKNRMNERGIKPDINYSDIVTTDFNDIKWFGFTVCIDLPETKKYTIGAAYIDFFNLSINGNLMVSDIYYREISSQTPLGNITTKLTPSSQSDVYKIFELELNKGRNIFEFKFASLGRYSDFEQTIISKFVINYFAEIYSVDIETFKLENDLNTLNSMVLFSTLDVNEFDIFPNNTNICPEGYIFSPCENTCVKLLTTEKEFIGNVLSDINSNISLLDDNNKKLTGQYDLCVSKIPTIYPESTNNDCGCDENIDDESLLITINDLATKTYTSPYKLLFGTNEVRGSVFTYRLNEVPKLNISFDLTLYYNSDDLLQNKVFTDLLTQNNSVLDDALNSYLSNINLSFNIEKIVDNSIKESFGYSLLNINDLTVHLETFGLNNGIFIGGEEIDAFNNQLTNIDKDLLSSKPFKYTLSITDESILELLRNQEIKFSIGINSAYTPLNIIVNNIDFNSEITKSIETISIENNFGFELEKVVDNKKSWKEDDTIRINDLTNRLTDYTTSDDKLILNSKNVDIEINVIKAVEIFIGNFAKDEFNISYNDLIKVNSRLTTIVYDNLVTLYRIYVGLYNGGEPNLSYNDFIEYINSLNINWIGLVEQFVNSTSIWDNTERLGNSIFTQNKFRYLPYQVEWGEDDRGILSKVNELIEFNTITPNSNYNSLGTIFYGLDQRTRNTNFDIIGRLALPYTIKSNNDEYFMLDGNGNLWLDYASYVDTNVISDNTFFSQQLSGTTNDVWHDPMQVTGRLNNAGVEIVRYSDKMEYFDIEVYLPNDYTFKIDDLIYLGVGKSDKDSCELSVNVNGTDIINMPSIPGNTGQLSNNSTGASFFSVMVVPFFKSGKNIIRVGHKAKTSGCEFALEVYRISGLTNQLINITTENELEQVTLFSTKQLSSGDVLIYREVLKETDIVDVDVNITSENTTFNGNFDSIKIVNYNYNNTFKGSFKTQ